MRHSQRRHLLAAHKIVHQQTGTVMGGGEEAQEKSNSSDKEQQWLSETVAYMLYTSAKIVLLWARNFWTPFESECESLACKTT